MWKRNLLAFLGLSLLAGIVVLEITISPRTCEALSRLKPPFIILAFGLWLGWLLFDALRLKAILSGLGARLKLLSSARVLLTGAFMAAITPFGAGGLPVQFYLLSRDGVSPGLAGAALLLRGLLTACLLAVALPLIGAFASWALKPGFIRAVLYHLVGLYTLFLLLIILLLSNPARIRSFAGRVVKFFWPRPGSALAERLDQELDRFRTSLLGLFRSGQVTISSGLLLTMASALAFFLIAPVLLYGLGVEVPLVQVVILQIVLVFVLSLTPTPGGAGLAETGAAALYGLICPFHLLGVYTLLWRFFACYLGAGLGGLALLPLLHHRQLDRLLTHKPARGSSS